MISICQLLECAAPVGPSRGWCEPHYKRWWKYGDPRAGVRFPPGVSLVYRLEALSDRSGGPTSCWPWLGCSTIEGYGRLYWQGRMVMVTHLVYELDRGFPPEKPCVLHTCDNPPCTNPRHLWSGTHTDNIRDMERKGRANHPNGELHGRAKRTANQIREIRARYTKGGVTQRQLGEEYRINPARISEIIRRGTWKSVA